MNKVFKSKFFFFLFIVLLFYALFPIGIESEYGIFAIRIVCMAVFLIYTWFIIFSDSFLNEKERKSEKPDKQIIKEFAEYYNYRKNIDTQNDFKFLMRSILSILKAVFACEGAGLFILKQSENSMVLSDYVTNNREYEEDFLQPLDTFPFSDCIDKKKGKIFYLDDIKGMNLDFIKKGSIISLMIVPVIYRSEILGLIFVDSDVEQAFSEEDQTLLESFAELFAMGIINYNLISDLEMNAKLFSIFYEVSKHLNANLEYNEVIDILTGVIQEVYEYDRIAVSIKTENNKCKIYKVIGKEAGFPEGEVFDIDEGLNGWVIKKNQSVLVSDLEKGDYFIPRYSHNEKNNYNMRSFIGVPVSYGDSCMGVVSVESEKPNAYIEQHEKLLGMLANNIGSSLERTMIHKQLKKLAITDELTGLNNYRALRNRLNDEIERAKRYETKFSLLMVDIDHFKKFNDTYGHIVGDQVLKEISKILKDSLRNVDFLARYGGEEFVAILAETKLRNALLTAERIRKNIETSIINYKGKEYKITISIGVAEYMTDMSEEDILSIVDEAMYKAKTEGRNKVIPYYV